MIGTDFTEDHINEIKKKYFTSQNVEHQLHTRLRASIDLGDQLTERIGPKEVFAMKHILGDLDTMTKDSDLHYKLRDIL